ncbi:50S ribosomal protein L13 [Candidatus Desantisbacteria bacterium]|nr:50S ribosomal protein L13 [Candidatus Desantisbacteria bacterium]
MKTYMAKTGEAGGKWYIVDATNVALGRLASCTAKILRGKNNPLFTPHVDTGDSVIIVNADNVLLTGKKKQQKFYYRHTGYLGGLKSTRYDKLLSTNAEKVIMLAVKRMIPDTVLGRAMFRKLKVYAGDVHPHEAQKPEPLKLKV